MFSPDHPKLSRNAIPINDSEVLDFLKKLDKNNFLFNALQDADIKDRFLNEYFKWIQTSKLNHVKGIEIFKHLAYVHGSSQTFDFFYAENKNCRFRCFHGEFFYHALSWRNNYKFSYLEDDPLEKNDAVVMSIPFSGNGYLHEDTQQIIEKCNKLDIPVMIDMAYYNLVRDLDFSLDEPSISTITFSLSKGFCLLDRLRVGIRCMKKYTDDPIDVFNSYDMFNKAGAAVGLEILKNFSPDFNQNKYYKKQKEICSKFNMQPSKCIIFGLGGEEYSKFNRDSKWNRPCISNLLIDE